MVNVNLFPTTICLVLLKTCFNTFINSNMRSRITGSHPLELFIHLTLKFQILVSGSIQESRALQRQTDLDDHRVIPSELSCASDAQEKKKSITASSKRESRKFLVAIKGRLQLEHFIYIGVEVFLMFLVILVLTCRSVPSVIVRCLIL